MKIKNDVFFLIQKTILVFLLHLVFLKTYSQDEGIIKRFTVKDGLPSNLVYTFVKDNEGYIWFATDNGVAKYNGSAFKVFNTHNGLPTNDVFDLSLDSKNRIWLDSYKNGLYYIEKEKVKTIEGSNFANGYRFLFEKFDTIFFANNNKHAIHYLYKNKIYRYKKITKELRKAIKNKDIAKKRISNNKSNISKDDIINLLENSKNQWIIDKSNNLYLYRQSYINNNHINDYSSIGLVHRISYLKNYLCIINKNYELYLYNLSSKKLTFIKSYLSKIEKSPSLSILKNKDRFLIPSKNSTDVLMIFKDTFKLKTIKSSTINYSRHSDNYKDIIYSVIGKKIKEHSNKETLFFLKDIILRLNHIKVLEKNFIITSNENGVHLINLIDKSSISNNEIKNTITINFDNENILIGTTKSLFILNKKLKILQEIKLNSKINSITYEEKSKIIYLLANKGIIIISKKNNEYSIRRIINEKDGLTLRKKNKICFREKDVLVLEDKGYSIINKSILEEKIRGEIEILNFYANDSSINFEKKVFLKRNFNNIKITNAIKTNDNTINLNKYYSINNNEWVKFNEPNLKFNELKPGDYNLTLGLKGIDNDNVFLNKKKINFYIEPYFFEKKIFIYILVVLSSIISLLFFNEFKKRQQEKNILKNNLNILEMKAFKSQMNPHFIFNSLNNIQSSFLLDDLVKSNKIFINFSKLLRTTLEMVNEEEVTLKKEINYLKEYLSVIQSNHNTKINIIFNIDKSINLTVLKIPVLLLQPIVENAIEHGLLPSKKEKRLIINILDNSNLTILIEIIDNGVGRKPNKKTNKSNSYGTSIIKNRLNLLNKIKNINHYKIKIIDLKKNDKNYGTHIKLQIPKS